MLKLSGFNGYPNEITLVGFFLTSAIALECLVLVAPVPSIIASFVTPVSSVLESSLLLAKATSEVHISLYEYGEDDSNFAQLIQEPYMHFA